MTPEHRHDFDLIVKAARDGNKIAVKWLRNFAKRLCENAPTNSLIRVVETFADVYADEIIDWHETERRIG